MTKVLVMEINISAFLTEVYFNSNNLSIFDSLIIFTRSHQLDHFAENMSGFARKV